MALSLCALLSSGNQISNGQKLVKLFCHLSYHTQGNNLMFLLYCSLKVFAFAGVVGLCALLPINYMGSQIVIDFSDFTNKSLESFSISNVNDGSKR